MLACSKNFLLKSTFRNNNISLMNIIPLSMNNCRQMSNLSALDDSLIITNSCAKRIHQLREVEKQPDLYLRVAVDSGGCSGFQYEFVMEKIADETIEDTDLIFEKNDIKVIVDEHSFPYIKGSTVDYEQELIRSAFAIVNNPQSEKACGCGSSFALKNFEANSTAH